ncbi:MAG: hypothetical protein DRN16_03090 [Thermoplasmata archaeon]|nr:MAG: hypothetical protein DRN16_03090 [Thermoplasmata archaeon]
MWHSLRHSWNATRRETIVKDIGNPLGAAWREKAQPSPFCAVVRHASHVAIHATWSATSDVCAVSRVSRAQRPIAVVIPATKNSNSFGGRDITAISATSARNNE